MKSPLIPFLQTFTFPFQFFSNHLFCLNFFKFFLAQSFKKFNPKPTYWIRPYGFYKQIFLKTNQPISESQIKYSNKVPFFKPSLLNSLFLISSKPSFYRTFSLTTALFQTNWYLLDNLPWVLINLFRKTNLTSFFISKRPTSCKLLIPNVKYL